MRSNLGRLDAIVEILQIGSFLEPYPGKWKPVFPGDKREAFARRSCSKKRKRIRARLASQTAMLYCAKMQGYRMKVFRIAAAIALLTTPAYAQMPNMNILADQPSKTPEEKEQEAAQQKAYKESLKKIPEVKASSDPWGNVRSTETTKPAVPAKRTKTGSTGN
jgi:hypothetical protein